MQGETRRDEDRTAAVPVAHDQAGRRSVDDSAVATTPIDERAGGARPDREGTHSDSAARETRAFIDALRALETEGDVDRITALYANDADVSNPTDAAPHRGAAGARRFWSAYRAAFTRVESRFRNVVQSGDTALLEWRSEGQTAAGAPFAYDGVSVLEFDDAKRITRFRAYFDPAKLTSKPAV